MTITELRGAIKASFDASMALANKAGKTGSLPGLGVEGSADRIVADLRRVQADMGASFAHLYMALVSQSLIGNAEGYGPKVVHWKIAKALGESTSLPGTPYECCERLAAMPDSPILRSATGKGKTAWLPTALDRAKPEAKAKGTTGTTDYAALVAGLLGTTTTEKPKRQRKAKA